jgi:hypothetical protein
MQLRARAYPCLTGAEWGVLCAVVLRSDNESGVSYASVTTIAADAHVSYDAATDALKGLAAKGLLTITPRKIPGRVENDTSIYALHTPAHAADCAHCDVKAAKSAKKSAAQVKGPKPKKAPKAAPTVEADAHAAVIASWPVTSHQDAVAYKREVRAIRREAAQADAATMH